MYCFLFYGVYAMGRGWVHVAQIGGKDTKKTADSELSAVKYYELCKNMFILFC